LPEEECYVARSVEKRQREFIASRACARSALLALGVQNTPLRVGKFREPVWPSHVVGSISHDCDICLAAVQYRSAGLGLGVDITENAELSPEVQQLLCSPDERSHLETARERCGQVIDVYRAMFSIKEAVYKCAFPLVQQLFDFKSVSVVIDPLRQSADVHGDILKRAGIKLACRFVLVERNILCAAWTV
jgi:4'-phosphopantetheinyl transferase EntD